MLQHRDGTDSIERGIFKVQAAVHILDSGMNASFRTRFGNDVVDYRLCDVNAPKLIILVFQPKKKSPITAANIKQCIPTRGNLAGTIDPIQFKSPELTEKEWQLYSILFIIRIHIFIKVLGGHFEEIPYRPIAA
jgi:hypothetical protein